jgi:transcriptional regulator with XRE-family HTH domain
MNIGKAMKIIREENGLSRPELAKKLGCTPTSIWKIENNRVVPKKSTVEFFCFMTKTPLARLYSLAFEARDFAPYASVKDCCTAMRESGSFSDEEIESIANRLTK